MIALFLSSATVAMARKILSNGAGKFNPPLACNGQARTGVCFNKLVFGFLSETLDLVLFCVLSSGNEMKTGLAGFTLRALALLFRTGVEKNK